jgi:hypothetical protein
VLFRVTQMGNVGIGVSPSVQLHVKGSAQEVGRFDTTTTTVQTTWRTSGTLLGFIAGNSNEFGFYNANATHGISIAGAGVQLFGSSAGTPGTPGGGIYKFYIDTNDGSKLKVIGPSGTVTVLANP